MGISHACIFKKTKKNLKSKIVNQVGFSSLVKNRVYVSESEQDVLHSGREHLEYNLAFWVKKEFNKTIDISVKFKYRYRDVTSAYEWVSELKEFNKFEVIFNISYKKALNILF